MKAVSSIRFRSDYIMRAWLVAKGFTMRQTVVVIVYWKAKDKGRECFPGKRIWCFLGTARYYCLQLWKLWRYWFGEITGSKFIRVTCVRDERMKNMFTSASVWPWSGIINTTKKGDTYTKIYWCLQKTGKMNKNVIENISIIVVSWPV